MFTSLPDAPQGVGDVVGLACRFVRGNFRLIWNFLLVPTVFATIAGVMFQWVLTYGVSNFAQTKDVGTAFGLAGIWFVGILVFFIAWWILGLRLLALTRLALHFAPNIEEAAKYMYRRKWSVLGVYFLTLILMMAVVVAWTMVVGAGVMLSSASSVAAALAISVGVFGLVVSMGVYVLTSHLALCILACEDEPVTAVIGRALSLIFRHFWRAIAFGIIFAVTFTVISYPLSLPIAVLTFFDAIQHGLGSSADAGGYKPPLYILVIAQTWESLTGMYLRPLVVFGFGLFYYDLRLRSEGLDIRRKLESLLPKPV